MKVALCLYGQPRQAAKGHKVLNDFLRRQGPDVSVEVYLHAWHNPLAPTYDVSPWRAMSDDELRVQPDIVDYLLAAYRPVAYRIDKPIPLDVPGIRDSILFRNSSPEVQRNLQNTLCQMYSKQAVRDLLMASDKQYDFVVASRFDFLVPIQLSLHKSDPSKLYVADFHRPRHIFPDNLVFCGMHIFQHLFDLYEEGISNIMNDHSLLQRVFEEYNEAPNLTAEFLLFATFIKHYENTNHVVVYSSEIPDFH